jgi:1,4-dihydroxy-2-naphthoyl-CoA hydrolase
MGNLHGGVSVVLAETAATMGAWMNMNIDHEKQLVVGTKINATHIRGKRDGIVTATATPLHIGQHSISDWDIKITDGKDNLICSSRCTLSVIEKR